MSNKDLDALEALLGIGILGSMTDVLKQPELKEAIKRKQEEAAVKADPVETVKKSASSAKRLYDAYVEAGFNEIQAFELLKLVLTTKR